ncbi:2,5-diamino-6-ribosylamino-4(3H)-pyrimidinone 5'-phosphate reductase [Candida viswanathii]|uniref:2,5-diamino-6-ribosylamino-4(3H)-pyrimidinone 5'-phosphate reductase n=1 Tax=Candida viswanathii TaxID=5486 RepID=A0A367YC38_9ASCO|nr:2,5-diamino-6-ribosylamino-4(3H)-pyrimidinone 5'-phosphate reductase [Candida viswanathii]
MSLIPLPPTLIPFLEPYLPTATTSGRPFVTLTYAQSLDSKIAAQPGVQTKLSHLETKAMTHYLRSKHDAILVGIGTVLADDPKLNCRYGDKSNIRPVILDPRGVWEYEKSALRGICDDGAGLAPFVIVDERAEPTTESINAVELQGGKYVKLPLIDNREDNWGLILEKLWELGIKSVMVEGGAKVINDLLVNNDGLVDSLIITVAPVFLGKAGVDVSPNHQINLKDMTWWTGVQDSVLAARLTP